MIFARFSHFDLRIALLRNCSHPRELHSVIHHSVLYYNAWTACVGCCSICFFCFVKTGQMGGVRSANSLREKIHATKAHVRRRHWSLHRLLLFLIANCCSVSTRQHLMLIPSNFRKNIRNWFLWKVLRRTVGFLYGFSNTK